MDIQKTVEFYNEVRACHGWNNLVIDKKTAVPLLVIKDQEVSINHSFRKAYNANGDHGFITMYQKVDNEYTAAKAFSQIIFPDVKSIDAMTRQLLLLRNEMLENNKLVEDDEWKFITDQYNARNKAGDDEEDDVELEISDTPLLVPLYKHPGMVSTPNWHLGRGSRGKACVAINHHEAIIKVRKSMAALARAIDVDYNRLRSSLKGTWKAELNGLWEVKYLGDEIPTLYTNTGIPYKVR